MQHTANLDFELVMSPRLVRELATVMVCPKLRPYFSLEQAERLVTDL